MQQFKMSVDFKMPKMGESILDATILNWFKNENDYVEQDEILLEVATDKVDNEILSPVSGFITKIFFKKDDVVNVGQVLAKINPVLNKPNIKDITQNDNNEELSKITADLTNLTTAQDSIFFLSPLIISIAQKENISIEELQSISGSGFEGRLRKSDLNNFLKNRLYPLKSFKNLNKQKTQSLNLSFSKVNFIEGKDSLIEMDRMGLMLANQMVYSMQSVPHVTTIIEVDVNKLVIWYEENKIKFFNEHQEKITFTPIFIQLVSKAIVDFPMINVSFENNKIVVHKDINIGIATALSNGNLIVPVIKNANQKSIIELAKSVNHLVESARNNNLKPDEIQDGTFTITNVGTFGSLMGTPIIKQPEAAILAVGLIKKRPIVATTKNGDEIVIRSMMYMSLSFDHRVINGFLAGSFLRKIGDYFENFIA